MKYAFINRHRRVWPISVQCRVLEASVARYHEHFVRAASAAQRRHLSDDALLVHIKAIHAETRGGCGWPRTWKELLARGIRVGKERVPKLITRIEQRLNGRPPRVLGRKTPGEAHELALLNFQQRQLVGKAARD